MRRKRAGRGKRTTSSTKTKGPSLVAWSTMAAVVTTHHPLPVVHAAGHVSSSTTSAAADPYRAWPRTPVAVSSRWAVPRTPRGGANADHDEQNKDDDHPSDSTPPPPPPPAKDAATNKKKKKKRTERTRRKRFHRDGHAPAAQEQTDDPNTASSSSSSTTTTPPNPLLDEILQHGDDYYRVLGLDRTTAVDNKALAKAYRRRALQTHPDKTGGDRRAFDKVAVAYEVLSDPTQRRLYDRYGVAGVQAGGGTGTGSAAAPNFPSPEDLFRSFFGGGGGGPSFFQQAPPRPRTVRYHLEVTLEELYQGATRNVALAMPQSHRSSSHFYHQHPTPKQVPVPIPRGALTGQAIRLSGVLDDDDAAAPPGMASQPPSDVVFYVQPRRHARFTRKGHDLALAVRISLDEAINGVTRTVRHLDGRSLTLQSSSTGTMIQSGDVHVLKGEGMPQNPQGTAFGDLYVQYEVTLPTPPRNRQGQGSGLTCEEAQELGRLLRKLEGKAETRPAVVETDNDKTSEQVHILQPAKASDFGTASGRPEMPRDEEEHEEEDQHPFASAFGRWGPSTTFRYSQSSSSNNKGAGAFFGMNVEDLFGANPGTDDENEQCRQM